MPWNVILGAVTCIAMMGVVVYLPMRLAGLFD